MSNRPDFHWSPLDKSPIEYRHKKLINDNGGGPVVITQNSFGDWRVREWTNPDIVPGKIVREFMDVWSLCAWLNGNEYYPE